MKFNGEDTSKVPVKVLLLTIDLSCYLRPTRSDFKGRKSLEGDEGIFKESDHNKVSGEKVVGPVVAQQ